VIPCVQTDGLTDGYDEANSCFFFCNFVKAPKNKDKTTRSDCDILMLPDIYTMYGNETVLSMNSVLKQKKRTEICDDFMSVYH